MVSQAPRSLVNVLKVELSTVPLLLRYRISIFLSSVRDRYHEGFSGCPYSSFAAVTMYVGSESRLPSYGSYPSTSSTMWTKTVLSEVSTRNSLAHLSQIIGTLTIRYGSFFSFPSRGSFCKDERPCRATRTHGDDSTWHHQTKAKTMRGLVRNLWRSPLTGSSRTFLWKLTGNLDLLVKSVLCKLDLFELSIPQPVKQRKLV